MDKYTIEYQELLGGFKNRGTFYIAFKKKTGLNPKQFFEQYYPKSI